MPVTTSFPAEAAQAAQPKEQATDSDRQSRPVTVLSNRGQSCTTGLHGALTIERASGGLVSTLGPGVQASGALWLATAATEGDRAVAAQGVVEAHGYRLSYLDIDGSTYAQYYGTIANETLWFVNHGLYDLPRRPRFDRRWHEAWEAYRRVNTLFAQAAAEATPEGGIVLIHDYHLALVGAELAKLRPDISTAAFLHTPWCTPAELSVLPEEAARELLAGLAGAGIVGFHSERWADAYRACCAEVLGIEARAFVSPAGVDIEAIAAVATSESCAKELAHLDRQLSGRTLVARVDRIELSKNILRGFEAYDEMLETRPELRERVTFGAFCYPSRQGIAEYRTYAQEVEALVGRINTRWSTPDWTPIIYDPSDHYERSVAALCRADVVLVNPVRDGLNLVAEEAAVVNERSATLVLSRTAGCWDSLGEYAIGVNPFDVSATADALATAVDRPMDQRAERAAALGRAVRANDPRNWFARQVAEAKTPATLS